MQKKKKQPRFIQDQYITFILDESGSMEMIKSSVISGFNEYLQTLKKKSKDDILFTLTKFDSEGIRTPYVAKPIADVPDLTAKTYQPGQMTPLYDAVCKTITEVEKKVQDGQPVLIAIMTDGMENYSKEFTEGNLASLIKRLQATGLWTFVFMGANQDSWLTAQRWGVPKGNVMDWEATDLGSKSIMRSFAESSAMYAASNQASFSSIGKGTTTMDFFNTTKKKKPLDKKQGLV